MKKLLISRTYNTLNYGSAMMTINLINGIYTQFEGRIDIYCDCDDYSLERLKEATGLNKLKNYQIVEKPFKSKLGKIINVMSGRDEYFSEIKNNFNYMIVLGGDDLSEVKQRYAMLLGLLYFKLNKTCKVILAGQSFGPFSGFYKTLAKNLFKKIILITRDDNSYDFSKKVLKLKNVYKSRDLALLPLPRQEYFSNILNSLNIEKEKYIVLVPSGLYKKYTYNLDDYLMVWKRIVEDQAKTTPTYKILLLAHVIGKGSSDAEIIEHLTSLLPLNIKENLITITEPMQPAEARSILGNSRYVITGRMHAAISTLFMGKPAISLAYSEKYFGVISRGLHLGELVIDTRKLQWTKSCELPGIVIEKVKFIESNYMDLKTKIKNNVEESSKLSQNHFKILEELIK